MTRSTRNTQPVSDDSEFEAFCKSMSEGCNLYPLQTRIFSDQLTPVVAYRCLVREADDQLPSFLLESVNNGDQQGRYSFLGANPAFEVVAKGREVTILNHAAGKRETRVMDDPMLVPEDITRSWKPAKVAGVPPVFTGGWVGYAGYDTVRYVYSGKLPFESAPTDDRRLPDLNLALYHDVVVFDQATKVVHVISWLAPPAGASRDQLRACYEDGRRRVAAAVDKLNPPVGRSLPSLSSAAITLSLGKVPETPATSDMTKAEYMEAVEKTKEHIQCGDVFQLVLSHRFERRTFSTPFEIYRALRVVNPSPYMVYMQARGCHIVSSSPEILCRVDSNRRVTNRPLAGTRARGVDAAADSALETELLADQKERAEHVMLVDLGRNDVGKVSEAGSVVVEKLMEVERYSHVMHISSTVTGQLLPELDAWDALRAALPVGTVSGAPKVRAMQIIDKLEKHRRGPYGGGIGHVAFSGTLDMALGLRTMVIPDQAEDALYRYASTASSTASSTSSSTSPPSSTTPAITRRERVIHLQAGAGIVADSVPESEYQETVNKAAALGRAIDLAEQAFL
nr:anthranilate synthase alpha subunit (TRPE) [Polytomella parva]|eukprot:CAMPEP_0175055808 /NCGR_PEP_ID=MMETSP0052_2-20121109/10297_1 /TAXON_ID=51329 ORGANISM="Polytomella parva, Strain SAG 63-3" /NCGR_SAMPLE_ID=MMETSP0052_2 /ASSEMBLY_ACC=CAM_ASM_000194 /LENGTH=566 /DNA_ID=CAMNT_0016320717 /DNA_START=150 /DNA_END=1850 /DNA_ORIENTATION=+